MYAVMPREWLEMCIECCILQSKSRLTTATHPLKDGANFVFTLLIPYLHFVPGIFGQLQNRELREEPPDGGQVPPGRMVTRHTNLPQLQRVEVKLACANDVANANPIASFRDEVSFIRIYRCNSLTSIMALIYLLYGWWKLGRISAVVALQVCRT